jgi:hypothetical protein
MHGDPCEKGGGRRHPRKDRGLGCPSHVMGPCRSGESGVFFVVEMGELGALRSDACGSVDNTCKVHGVLVASV